MDNAHINIIIKPLALNLWKPSMSILDFHLPLDEQRYSLTQIVTQKIVRNSQNALVSIEYYDSRSNQLLTTNVKFKFKHSKTESIAMLLHDDQFIFNTKKLCSLNFINFNEHDLKVNDKNIKIESIVIKNWSIFNQHITFKINVVVYNDIRKSVLITKPLMVNSTHLIRKLLTCEPNESLLQINSYLEFEVQRFSPLIKNYHFFFGKTDYKQLFSIVREIEIFNPKILTLDIDVFKPNAIAHFNAAVAINNEYFKDLIFKSTYDARNLQTLIKTRLLELPLRATIQGHPRTIGISLKHIYQNYKRIYLKTMLSKNGISNLFDHNVVIKITNYRLKSNRAKLEIYLKNSSNDSIPIISRTIAFQKTLQQFADYRFQDNNFITLKNKALIDKNPLFTPQVSDFNIVKKSLITILSVRVVDDIPLQSRWGKYQFQLLANDPTTQITFDYFQDFYFASSRLEYLFQNINLNDFNLHYLTTKNDQYYHEIAVQFNQNWIPIFDPNVLTQIILNERLRETDFKIIKLQFNKDALFKIKLPILITIWSDILRSARTIKASIKIVQKQLLLTFNKLIGSDIKLVNNNIVASYPIPLLDVNDFYTHRSFKITEMSARYNENNSSVTCTFVVTLGSRQRIIKNIYYFANDAINRIPKQTQAKELNAFKALNKHDVVVSFDENNQSYFINPKVDVQAKNAAFYARANKWTIKSRWRKLIDLNIEIKYCSYSKSIIRTIKFKNRISHKDYKAWKEANYDLK